MRRTGNKKSGAHLYEGAHSQIHIPGGKYLGGIWPPDNAMIPH
jgi:hypothetical protein